MFNLTLCNVIFCFEYLNKSGTQEIVVEVLFVAEVVVAAVVVNVVEVVAVVLFFLLK